MRKSTGKVIVWCLLGLPAMVCPANADLPSREIGESGWAEMSVEAEGIESRGQVEANLASAYVKDCVDVNMAKAWDMAGGVSDARPVEKRESTKSPEGGAAVLKTSRIGGKVLRTWQGAMLPTPEPATTVMLITSGLVGVSVRVIRRYRASLR